jgi:hypothetical protein
MKKKVELHDAHVEAYKRHHGIHDSHVECRERFKAELHDGHVKLWKEQKGGGRPMLEAVLRGMEQALAKHPDSKRLKQMVADQRALLNGKPESRDWATLFAMRPMD